MALWGCGDSDESGSQERNASVDISIQWYAPEQKPDENDRAIFKNAEPTSCEEIGVNQVAILVYDEKDEVLDSGNWPCVQHSGDPLSIAPGDHRRFIVLGLDAQGVIISHGETTASLSAGEKTEVGIIADLIEPKKQIWTKGISYTAIAFTWDAADDLFKVDGYKIYMGHEKIASNSTVPDQFVRENLDALTEHCFWVAAYDNSGHEFKIAEEYCKKTLMRTPDTGQPDWPGVEGDDGETTINPPFYSKLNTIDTYLDQNASDWAMVRDNVTGLIWAIDTLAGVVETEVYSWEQAERSYIKTMNDQQYGGISSWRLPTAMELYSLVNFADVLPDSVPDRSADSPPRIDTAYFPDITTTPQWWWTASTIPDQDPTKKTRPLCVSFKSGKLEYWEQTDESGADRRYRVRAVYGYTKKGPLTPNPSGVVSDPSTGLMWIRMDRLPPADFPSLVNPDGSLRAMTWPEALAACKDLSFAGYNDWRVPNIKELLSISKEDGTTPSIDTSIFTDHIDWGDYFWSSTSYVHVSKLDQQYPDYPGDFAWGVTFWGGNTWPLPKNSSEVLGNNSTKYIFLRPVRGGKIE